MSHSSTQKNNTFFGGAAILALGIIVVKIIGFFYKVPLINVIGEQGAADFNNAYNIYSVLLSVSTAGLPVALSKLVSEANATGRHNQVRKTFHVALCIFLLLGIASCLVMTLFSTQLAEMMNDTLAAPGILALAPAVVCVGCLSAFRGYFQGHGRMTPTAISQVVEALTKLVLGLSLATLIMNMTFTTDLLAQYRPDLDVSSLAGDALTQALEATQASLAAAGAIVGVTVGTMLALLVMFCCYMFTGRKRDSLCTDRPQGSREILVSILKISIPITISSSMVSLVTLLESALMQGQLQNALGLSEDMSRTLFGNYSSALTLYNLPLSLMVAITTSVIPAVSAARARSDRRGASRIVGSALRVTALLAFPMGVGLFVLGTPIIQTVFPVLTPEIAGPLLSILGLAVPFTCLTLVCNSVLHAHGLVNLPVFIMLLGGGLKLIVNYILVGIPQISILGAPVGSVLCFALCVVLDLFVIARVIPDRPAYGPIFVKPALAAALMGVAAWSVYGLTAKIMLALDIMTADGVLSFYGNAFATLFAIAVAAVIYLVLVVLLRAISKEDLALMPKGDKIAKILRL